MKSEWAARKSGGGCALTVTLPLYVCVATGQGISHLSICGAMRREGGMTQQGEGREGSHNSSQRKGPARNHEQPRAVHHRHRFAGEGTTVADCVCVCVCVFSRLQAVRGSKLPAWKRPSFHALAPYPQTGVASRDNSCQRRHTLACTGATNETELRAVLHFSVH